MMLNWNHRIGATALAVALLASTGGFLNEAKAVETGQLLIKDKPRPAARNKSGTIQPNPPTATEKGIKDPGVKSCGSCGLTAGRVAAPPAVADPAPPPPSVDIETGQLLIKDKPTAATERRAHNGPGGTPPATAKNQLCGVPYTPPCVTGAAQRSASTATKGGKSALALGIGGLAALAAIVAATSGGTPVSR